MLCYLAGNFLLAPRILFFLIILMLIYFFKYKTIETHARTFLPFNISAVGSVQGVTLQYKDSASSSCTSEVTLAVLLLVELV